MTNPFVTALVCRGPSNFCTPTVLFASDRLFVGATFRRGVEHPLDVNPGSRSFGGVLVLGVWGFFNISVVSHTLFDTLELGLKSQDLLLLTVWYLPSTFVNQCFALVQSTLYQLIGS